MANATTTEQLRSIRLVFPPEDVTSFEPVNNLELFVPDSFGRKSLRKTISELSKDSPVDSLDFAIEGILLRTTLGKFCEKYERSRENILEISCFQRETQPKKISSGSQGRWFSCLHGLHLSDSIQVVAGDTEGLLSGWNLSDGQISSAWEVLACKDATNSTVIGIDCLPSKRVLIACLQTGLLVFGSLESNENVCLPLHQLNSLKKNSIESVLFHRSLSDAYDSIFLGTFGGSIVILPKNELALDTVHGRQEKNLLCPKTEEALLGHSLRVSSVVSLDMNTLLSSSWDGTVKVWDINRSCLISSTNIGRPVNSLTRSLNQDYCVAGNMDGSFTLLDRRQEKPALRQKFAHSLANTAICSSPHKNHLFCTAGRDNKMKIWDSRALSTPFYQNSGKGGDTFFTCLFWDNEADLLSAGNSGGELSCLLFEDGKLLNNLS